MSLNFSVSETYPLKLPKTFHIFILQFSHKISFKFTGANSGEGKWGKLPLQNPKFSRKKLQIQKEKCMARGDYFTQL